jgi:hypothetical protein
MMTIARRSRCAAVLAAAASATFAGVLVGSSPAAADWSSTLTREPRGSFPDLRPVRATYTFGWSGLTAGSAKIRFLRGDANNFVLEGHGRSVGLARVLWKFDVDYRSVADAETLRPLQMHQIETARGKRIETQLAFSDRGVTRTRIEGNPPKASTRDFAFENVNGLQSVLLYLRSQPLHDHSTYRVVVYPANSAYLATITVAGHERTRVRAGSYNAIKLDLQLQRVAKNDELEPHRKFRRASIWISDDSDRILLRIEAQIFIGSVTAELQSIQFES